MKIFQAVIFFISIVTSASAQLGQNLLKNPGAESGVDYWTQSNSGWGFSSGHTGSQSWITSTSPCTMSQMINLIDSGYSAAVLDASPDIAVSVYVYPGWSSGESKGTITIKVELLNSVDDYITSPLYICNNDTLPLSMTDWTEKSASISGYPSGLRKIRLYLIGKDAIGWEGNYGPAFDDASLQLDGPVPVELTTVTATAQGKNVELKWNTATETNNYGFEVERKIINNEHLAMNNWGKIGFVEGSGTTNAPKAYSFVDLSAQGKTAYRLKQIDRDGKFVYSQEVEAVITQIPQEFALIQNYPNPFNPVTMINYQLPMNSYVTLKVFDALGREVATLVNEIKEAGTYNVQFDGTKLSSGIYFYTLRAGKFTATKKLTLIK